MNSLVGYGSSDDEEVTQPERPAKIAKTDADAPATIAKPLNDVPARPKEQLREEANVPAPQPQLAPSEALSTARIQDITPPRPSAGPALAPSATEDSSNLPFDLYTFERQRLRELTMPTIPNFDIPDSPPPPARNSEEAAVLAETTKKFERFLELKKQGVHFNERLQNSTSLRNPSLLPKLMEFAGVSREESYASSLSEELAVPVRWPDESYIEGLLKQNERREKKRLQERDKLDFVPAKSAGSSASGTPGGGGLAGPKRSKFDRK